MIGNNVYGGGNLPIGLMPIDIGIGYYYDFKNCDVGVAPSTIINKGNLTGDLSIYNSTILSNKLLQTTGAGNNSYAITPECYPSFSNLIIYGVTQLSVINAPNWLFSTVSSTYDFGIALGRVQQTDNIQYSSHYIQSIAYNEAEVIGQTIATNLFCYCYLIKNNGTIIHYTYSYPNKFTTTEFTIGNFNNKTTQSLSQCILGGYIKDSNKYGGATVSHGMIAIGNELHSNSDICYNMQYLYNKYN